jgi:hypothetical protein
MKILCQNCYLLTELIRFFRRSFLVHRQIHLIIIILLLLIGVAFKDLLDGRKQPNDTRCWSRIRGAKKANRFY